MLTFETVDVFTGTRFGGNPLAVVFGGEALDTADMLKIAREFNYSETTFVLPPSDPSNTANVRIFTPAAELPFAGHPNIGTAFVLANRRELFGRPLPTDALRFEELAGVVPVTLSRDPGGSIAATLTAPQPFARMETSPTRQEVATCLSLPPEEVVADPIVCSVGSPYVIAELASAAALERCVLSLGGFSAAAVASVGKIHAFVRAPKDDVGDARDPDIKCRMFTARGSEDPATGAANCALLGFLATELSGEGTLVRRIEQGVTMGRPSLLLGEVDYSQGKPTAVRIGGGCVPMMRGEFIQALHPGS